MPLQPLADRIIVRPLKKEEMTKAGLFIPDTVDKERPEQGEVISVGSGRTLENGTVVPVHVSVGDVVVFKKYAPDEIKVDDEELLIISECDVMAIVTKK